MAVRINGVTFRSGCDINILMESRDLSAKLDTPEAREARIALYEQRYANRQDIFDGTPLMYTAVSYDELREDTEI